MTAQPSFGLSETNDLETTQTASVRPSRNVRNDLNDLTATEWIAETVSVWRQKGLGANHPDARIEKEHPAPFSFTDVARVIRFFSKAGQTVLDPFVGIGSTLKAAALEGRQGIGIELSPRFFELATRRLSEEVADGFFPLPEQRLIQGDARDVLPTLADHSVDLVVTSPPYWNILHKADHKVTQERVAKGLATRYSQDDRDLGNIADYDEFLAELVGIFRECGRILRPKKYLCAVGGEVRHWADSHDVQGRSVSQSSLKLRSKSSTSNAPPKPPCSPGGQSPLIA